MAKINLTEEDLRVLSECINNQTEIPEDLMMKLSPGFFDKLRQSGKFDYKELDKYKVPTIEYAGKRAESVILAQAAITGGAAPLQIVRSFANGKNGDWKNLIVQGDNLQFLKTCYMNQDPLIKDKVKGKVKLIYIDPPFGTGDEYGGNELEMSYSAKIKGAEFVETLRERLFFLREILSSDGTIFVRIDYHFGHYIKGVMDEVYNKENFINEIIVNRITKKGFAARTAYKARKYPVATDVLYVYGKTNSYYFKPYRIPKQNQKENWHAMDVMDANPSVPKPRMIFGERMLAPPGRKWMYSQENIYEMEKKGLIKLNSKGKPIYKVKEQKHELLDTNWTDIPGYSFSTGYPTENSEQLLKRVIATSSSPSDLILDCFAGSGTTAAVAEKLGRRWIMCDFGKHAIYTMQKRILNIAESKKLGPNTKKNEKYGKSAKPFCIVSAGAYDFSRIMNLRKDKDVYISFVLGLFGIMRDDVAYSKKYKLPNIYAEKEGNPVEIFPVWDDEYLRNVRIDEEYLQGIITASGGKLKGDYYIIVPETCTIIADTNLKNSNKESVDFKLLKFPYKVLEDVSRQFQIEEQPSAQEDINKLISTAGFYFNEDVRIVVERIESGLKIAKFETGILSKNKERFKGFEGLSMILIDKDYDGKVFDMDTAVYAKEIGKDGIMEVEGLGKRSYLIAIDKHGNESKIMKIG